MATQLQVNLSVDETPNGDIETALMRWIDETHERAVSELEDQYGKQQFSKITRGGLLKPPSVTFMLHPTRDDDSKEVQACFVRHWADITSGATNCDDQLAETAERYMRMKQSPWRFDVGTAARTPSIEFGYPPTESAFDGHLATCGKVEGPVVVPFRLQAFERGAYLSCPSRPAAHVWSMPMLSRPESASGSPSKRSP